MDSKYQKSPLHSKRTGVKSHGGCPGYLRTSSSYSETIYTGSAIHAYTKDRTGIDTGMVHVTLSFGNVTARPNGIRVKYSDGNISQAIHSSLLKLPFLPVEAHHVHLFDTLALGSLPPPRKICNAGCTAYFNAKKSKFSSRVNLSSEESDLPPLPSSGNNTETITSTKNIKKFNQ